MNPSKFSGARKYTLVLELCEYAPASKLKINSVIIHLSPPPYPPLNHRVLSTPLTVVQVPLLYRHRGVKIFDDIFIEKVSALMETLRIDLRNPRPSHDILCF